MDEEKAYVSGIEEQLKLWQEAMDKIQKKIAKLSHDEKVQCQDIVKNFYEKMPVVYQHLDALQKATPETRDKIKHDIESSTGELKAAIEKLTTELGS
ncbi:MAG: hypothetical protein JW893_06430 [Candidatus Omnitrophica bacterium]|nr:hypothetical protein [Candidatus Omnitrophota bacterium]